MDSVSQFVLGAAVTAAVLGARTGAARAVLIGGVVATLPDLDVLIDRGDAVSNMTMHRADSHSLLWLTLATPLLVWLITRLPQERAHVGRWCVAVWVTLITHVLLDAMTIYGTQLLLPFTDHPFGVGSLFVIDPLYTLPLLGGLGVLLWRRGDRRGRRGNTIGLVLSTLYALWSLFAQQHVLGIARAQLQQAGLAAEQILVTPAPLQTLLWRIVVLTPNDFYEGSRSLLDGDRPIEFERFDRGRELFVPLSGEPAVSRLAWFSHGFCRMRQHGDRVLMADLRMGQEPQFAFEFEVARRRGDGELVALPSPDKIPTTIDTPAAMDWIWRRMWGEALPRPR